MADELERRVKRLECEQAQETLEPVEGPKKGLNIIIRHERTILLPDGSRRREPIDEGEFPEDFEITHDGYPFRVWESKHRHLQNETAGGQQDDKPHGSNVID